MKKLHWVLLTVALVVIASITFWRISNQQPGLSGANHPLPPNAAVFFSPDKLRAASSSGVAMSSAKPGTSLSPNLTSGLNKQSGNQQVLSANSSTTSGLKPRIQANFKSGDQDYHLQPDRFGTFPRVSAEAGQKIPVSVQFAQGGAGDPVVVQVEDGGSLPGKQVVQQTKLDDQLSAHFTFQAGTQEGIYRVTVRQGGQTQTLQFWVGPLPIVRSVSQ